ncbi:hypothetical protein AMATHDRAFT_72799 [Amanita thiersii Skay4041]|uniref:SHSP domain-containing protein n=1 Tax=Amanita thiersii Skay4041 TaxID=703135 RepID=A0A2A9NUP7_9AGAR|nr:hypothetical protein AMATHDRAFT_72799 [Amanita thiersii Skay4041]
MSSLFYYEPFYDIERFLDDALTSRFGGWGGERQLQRRGAMGEESGARVMKPRMDLHEDEKKNTVTATFELPGLRKEDIAIDVHNGRLIINGECKMSREHEESGYAVRERRYGKFSRTLTLPQGVKENEIKAQMENGVLTVTFPKASAEMAPKRITVG